MAQRYAADKNDGEFWMMMTGVDEAGRAEVIRLATYTYGVRRVTPARNMKGTTGNKPRDYVASTAPREARVSHAERATSTAGFRPWLGLDNDGRVADRIGSVKMARRVLADHNVDGLVEAWDATGDRLDFFTETIPFATFWQSMPDDMIVHAYGRTLGELRSAHAPKMSA